MTPRLILPALLALAAFAAPAHAEAVVTLKPALEIAGDTIALSDLFEGVAAEADAPVARAPAPGAALSIDPEWLQRHARASGLVWPNAEGVRRVSVRRASQPLGPEQVAELVRDALAQRDHQDYAVDLDSAQTLHAPLGAPLAPGVLSLGLDPATHAFSAEIVLAAGLDPVRVTGRAEPSIDLPVLARAVARGATIGAADVSYVSTPASRVPADALGDADEIVGMAAKRALRAGVALKSFDLERPTIIARGEVVVVRFERGPLLLTARARALGDVAEGDQARFVNLQSSRVIEAVAVAPGEAWLVAANSLDVVGARPGARP